MSQDRYIALVLSFPSIRDYCPGIHDSIPKRCGQPSDWYVECLSAWIGEGRLSPGQQHAVEFCLNLWNSGGPWPAFDMFDALGEWDRPHQEAFAAWAAKPWRP